MVTSKLKRILILASAFILSACTQTADIYFYADESWQVSSKVTMSEFEQTLLDTFDQQLADLNLPIQSSEFKNALTEGGLDVLTSQYAAAGIDFSWRKFGSTYSYTAKGQTLAQFEKLVPGVFTITKEAEDRYHLKADFTEAMPLAAAVYKLELTLHATEIYSSNAQRLRSGTAQWTNPSTIDAVFAPSSKFPWGVLLTLCGASVLGAIPFFALAGKKKCPSCGKRISKKSEICPKCGDTLIGGWI